MLPQPTPRGGGARLACPLQGRLPLEPGGGNAAAPPSARRAAPVPHGPGALSCGSRGGCRGALDLGRAGRLGCCAGDGLWPGARPLQARQARRPGPPGPKRRAPHGCPAARRAAPASLWVSRRPARHPCPAPAPPPPEAPTRGTLGAWAPAPRAYPWPALGKPSASKAPREGVAARWPARAVQTHIAGARPVLP